MTYAECVIFTLIPSRKSAETTLHPVILECFATTGKNLMCIGLMSHVINDLVVRSIENIMNPHNQFDCTEA